MTAKIATRFAALVAFVALGSCNATKARINDNEQLFESYPPEVQAMIKSNRIDRGFDQTQVYLAYGNATRTDMMDGQEHWYYHLNHANSIQEEKSATEYRSEMYEYEKAVADGRENVPVPTTHRTITLRRTRVARIVRFSDGLVDSWDEPEEMWLDEWHE